MSEDLRTLGYSDAMAWAIVWVRNEIGSLNQRRPNPRHCRKAAQHDRKLAPLLALQQRFQTAYDEAVEAYEKTKKDAS